MLIELITYITLQSVRSKKKQPVPTPTTKAKTSNVKVTLKSSPSADAAKALKAIAAGGASEANLHLEKVRQQLQKLDARWREKENEEKKKFEVAEADQAKELQEKNTAALEETIRSLQAAYQQKMDETKAKLESQQAKEVNKVKEEEGVGAGASEERQAELERELAKLQKTANDEVEKYRRKREAELEEQIKRATEQCQTDIEEYSARHRAATEKLLEQVKQKHQLELRNDEQTSKLSATNKVNQIKERFAKSQAEESARLNEELAASIDQARTASAKEAARQQQAAKQALAKELETARARLETEYREERGRLEATITELEAAIKGSLKAEARELARRRDTKAHLLAMMALDDMWRVTDEELISRRHGFTIDRGAIIQASCSASTIYAATSKAGDRCYCKVTLLNKWSNRHRADFFKYSTRLARYLTVNFEKMPHFIKIIEVLATDSKVYTFMVPLECTRTLAAHLESLGKGSQKTAKKKSESSLEKKGTTSKQQQSPTPPSSLLRTSGLKKSEVVRIVKQVSKAAAYLNNMFIAHCAITPDNLTLLPPSSSGGGNSSRGSSLSHCKVVLTGLTRPIVYYNVESDCIIAVKGFEAPTSEEHLDLSHIEHLPPECFESEFIASSLDAYSIGILAYQLLRIGSPFADVPKKKLLAAKQEIGAEGVKLVLEEGSVAAEQHRNLPPLIASLTTSVQSKRLPIEDIRHQAYFKR